PYGAGTENSADSLSTGCACPLRRTRSTLSTGCACPPSADSLHPFHGLRLSAFGGLAPPFPRVALVRLRRTRSTRGYNPRPLRGRDCAKPGRGGAEGLLPKALLPPDLQ